MEKKGGDCDMTRREQLLKISYTLTANEETDLWISQVGSIIS